MALTNTQFEEIQRSYDEAQLRQARALDERREKIYAAIPEMEDLDAEMTSLSLQKARQLLGQEDGSVDLAAALENIRARREALLADKGFAPDALELQYDCPLCRDTGFVGSEKCTCFRQKELDLLYAQSNVQDLFSEDFAHFSLDYYPTEGSPSPRDAAQHALEVAQNYVANFGQPGADRNLCFYGNVGVGKTFLTHCIAKELLAKGVSVLYQPSYELFEQLGKYTFASDRELEEAHSALFTCDLLIIDDLGTELINSFTASQLFLIMNERALHDRATILSTNIPPEDFADAFSERVSSRLLGAYKLLPLSGNDIRILKRLAEGN